MCLAAAATLNLYFPCLGLPPMARTAATSGHWDASSSAGVPWNDSSHVARMSGKTRTRPSSPSPPSSSSSCTSAAAAVVAAAAAVAAAQRRLTASASHNSRQDSTVSMTSPRMSSSRSSCCTTSAPTTEGTPSPSSSPSPRPDSTPECAKQLIAPATGFFPPRAPPAPAAALFPKNTVSSSLCTAFLSTPSVNDNDRSRQ
eukprot:31398-Pelagococcus_subviridis.AAC.11